MKRHYFNKIPPFTPDPEHWTKKSHSWKAKVAYEEEEDAWEFLNQHVNLIAQGYRAYRCKVCQKWHVGHLRKKAKRRDLAPCGRKERKGKK